MTEEEERKEVRRRTEQNRKAVPATVIRALAAMSLTLDDVLKMSRQEFDPVNLDLSSQVSDDDRAQVIAFKYDSMTRAENLAYFEPTDAEWDELEADVARMEKIMADNPHLRAGEIEKLF